MHWTSQFIYSPEVFVDYVKDSFPNLEFLCQGQHSSLQELTDFLTWIKAK